ncbi:MAG TPA: DUF898 family protein [Terriglobia bacterium]|jgi:uncharacterized membrane protein YjgN (DUF898 family)
MRCPACGTENLENAWQCACGQYFGTPQQPPELPSRLNGRFHFHGKGTTLFGIYVRNLLLALVTFGVYYFWGKAEVRRYLYSQTEFEGDRFEFLGTGKELFIGALKASALFGGLVAIPRLAEILWQNSLIMLLAQGLYSIGLLILIPVAIAGSRRYRLTRTTWRGIRFSFRGHAKDLIPLFVKGVLLTVITLGLYYPAFQVHLRQFLTAKSYFGNKPFHYDGTAWELFRTYALGFFLSVLTLGLYYFWFDAERERYHWSHTTFSTARFRSTVRGHEFLGLALLYLPLLVLTLGLSFPWIQTHLARFRTSKLSLEGLLDLNAVQQEILSASATGEGMADMMDVGILDVDLGF